jgi:hypothetical protein
MGDGERCSAHFECFFFGFGHDLWMQNDTDDILGWFR